jgi:hypothetical protein
MFKMFRMSPVRSELLSLTHSVVSISQTRASVLAILPLSRIPLQTEQAEETWQIYSNIYPTRCNVTQFILSRNCCTCFGWYLYPSLGAQTTVSTASGICHTVIAIAADSSNGVTNTRCYRYSCLRS